MKKYDIFKEAARIWEQEDLPDFRVEGFLDGKNIEWTVPEFLRIAAKRLNLLNGIKSKEEMVIVSKKEYDDLLWNREYVNKLLTYSSHLNEEEEDEILD